MQRLILSLHLLFAAVAAGANEPSLDARKVAVAKELESFAGTWRIVSVKPEGATKGARRLVFNQDGTYAAQDAEEKELWAGTFEIDPTTEPKLWDHRSHEGKKENKDVLGIYDLKGDTLKVACVAAQWNGKQWVGKPRPNRFDSQEVDVTINLERIKSGD